MGKRNRSVSSSSASSCCSKGSPSASNSEDEASSTLDYSRSNKGAKSKLRKKIMEGLKQAAKAESTMSFRKTSNSSSSSQKRHREQHSKAKKTSSTSQKKGKALLFGRVALSTLEVVQNDELGHAVFADGDESQLVLPSDFVRWENMGLAITDFQNGIEVNPAWTYSEFLESMYTLFPRAAKYIKASPFAPNPEYQRGVDEDFKNFFCPFVLCMKEERRYVILPSTKANWPTGRDIANNCVSKNKNGWAENTLLLCSRVPFPMDVLQQWRRGKSPIPDPRAVSSDDEELEAGFTFLFQNNSAALNGKAKTVSAQDTVHEGKGKSKAQERSSSPSDEQPPPKHHRKTLFLSDSEDEGAEEKDEDVYFPGLQTAITNSHIERRTTRSMAGSSLSHTDAALSVDIGGSSSSNASRSASTSTPNAPDVLMRDVEADESDRPQWLTDSMHYMRRYNFTSSTFSSDRPKFRF